MTSFDAGFIVLLQLFLSSRNRRNNETLFVSLYLSVFNLLLFVNIVTTKPLEHAYNTFRYYFYVMSTKHNTRYFKMYDQTYDQLYFKLKKENPNLAHWDLVLLVYSEWYELDNKEIK